MKTPSGALEQVLETQLPEDVEVRVVEENPKTIYLVLPGTSLPPDEAEEQFIAFPADR